MLQNFNNPVMRAFGNDCKPSISMGALRQALTINFSKANNRFLDWRCCGRWRAMGLNPVGRE